MPRFPLALALLLTALASGRAATPPGIVPPNAPKSSFVDEPGLGRDPFFPESGRRTPAVVTPADPNANRPNVPDFLTLKGISISGGRKLAIINNYTVAEGEEFSLRYGTQVTKVKCVEIKERIVTVQVNGVAKELPLRASLN